MSLRALKESSLRLPWPVEANALTVRLAFDPRIRHPDVPQVRQRHFDELGLSRRTRLFGGFPVPLRNTGSTQVNEAVAGMRDQLPQQRFTNPPFSDRSVRKPVSSVSRVNVCTTVSRSGCCVASCASASRKITSSQVLLE